MMTRLLMVLFVAVTLAAAFTLSGCDDDVVVEQPDAAVDLRPAHD
jgi:hypothetical protein